MPNSLRKDPTRTTMLRRRMVADMVRRFKALSKEIYKFVVTDDEFGLEGPATLRQTYRFNSNAKKITAYRKWLKKQVDALILTPMGGISGKPWTAPYMQSAYQKGVIRAYTDLRKVNLAAQPSEFVGGRAEFIKQAFSGPIATESIELLYTRSFTELDGVTKAMDQQMSRILANGFTQGHGTKKIARDLMNNVTLLTNTRAKAIARTEIIRAHSEGQLDAFERLGVKKVGILAEWSTAGDDIVCDMCLPLEGVVMTIKEARGSLPRHPNCRCAWIPAQEGKKEKGQLWGKQKQKAIGKSIQAEAGKNIKKRTKKQIKKRSLWPGKHLI